MVRGRRAVHWPGVPPAAAGGWLEGELRIRREREVMQPVEWVPPDSREGDGV